MHDCISECYAFVPSLRIFEYDVFVPSVICLFLDYRRRVIISHLNIEKKSHLFFKLSRSRRINIVEFFSVEICLQFES